MVYIRLFIAPIFMLLTLSTHAFDRYTAHGGPIKGLAYSEASNLAVSASFDYTAVVWHADGMQELKRLVAHNAAVNAAAFSSDGQWLATGGDDFAIHLWSVDDLVNGSESIGSIPLTGHTAKIVHLEFSADGRTLLSSSWDHTVGIWDVESGQLIRQLKGHQGPVNAAVFATSGEQVYSAGADGHIRLWNLETGEYVRSLVRNGFGINVMDFDPVLDLLAYGGSNGVMGLVSLADRSRDLELWVGGPPVLAVSIDGASEKVAFGTAEGRVMIADTYVGDIEHDFTAVKGPVWAMSLLPNAEGLLFAGLDDWVTRIPLQDFKVPSRLPDRDRRFHPDEPIDNGQRQFARKCSVCHSLTASTERRAGPTLYGVFGRKVGAVAGYPYSPELKAMDLVWTEETIDALFRDGPDVVTPGSKMPIQRIKAQKDRDDLISYLKRATAPVTP
mgnify:CR=1 FL=1